MDCFTRLWYIVFLLIVIFTLGTPRKAAASTPEINYPVQEVEVTDSYLTKAHIKTNSKTQIQLIKIKKSFLVWVTIQKGKDNSPVTSITK